MNQQPRALLPAGGAAANVFAAADAVLAVLAVLAVQEHAGAAAPLKAALAAFSLGVVAVGPAAEEVVARAPEDEHPEVADSLPLTQQSRRASVVTTAS